MRRTTILVALLIGCGGGGEDAPSCQQAMTAYYGAGCTFIDLETGDPISQGVATAGCLELRSDLPDRCQADVDDFVSCLETSTPAEQCDCTNEQEAIIACQ